MTDEEMATGGLTDAEMAGGAVPEEGGPESFLHPDKFKPSPGRRPLKNTGPIEQVREEIRHEKTKYPTETSDIIAAPGLSMLDRATLGGLSGTMRLSNQINAAAGREPLFQRSLDAIEGYRASSPTASQYTDIPGYLTGGPRAIAMDVERIIPQVANPAAQVARATLASGVAGGTVAASEAATGGKGTAETLREGGQGAAGGAIVGAAGGTAAALLGGAARAVLGSKGAKAREYLEARGQPLTAPDTSDAAIGAAAQRTDDAVKAAMSEYKQKVATGPYMEELGKVGENDALRGRLGLPAVKDQQVDVTSIVADMAKAVQRPGIRPEAEAELRRQMDKALANYTPGTGPIMMSQEYLNELRQSLGTAAKFDSTDPKLSPIKRAFEQTKALVDQGPYAEANRRFAAGMADLENSLDMVGLETSRNVDEPIKGNLRVASQRQGQNTVTAGADTERLDIDAFKTKHPELANTIDAPEIIRRQGDIAFHSGAPGHGGLMERSGLHMSLPVATALALTGHGLKGAAAIPLAMALQNRNAIAGRVLYNPAQEAQIAAQMMLLGVPQAATPGREVSRELEAR